jgi:transcriptional regulator of met regulon
MDTREKGDYRKITTTVPQWAYGVLIQESTRRKIAGEPNQLLSALLREAITDYLSKLRGQSA